MPDNVTAPVHKFLSEGLTLDQVIDELKRIGFDLPGTINAIHRATTIPLTSVEARVRAHHAWNTGSPQD